MTELLDLLLERYCPATLTVVHANGRKTRGRVTNILPLEFHRIEVALSNHEYGSDEIGWTDHGERPFMFPADSNVVEEGVTLTLETPEGDRIVFDPAVIDNTQECTKAYVLRV